MADTTEAENFEVKDKEEPQQIPDTETQNSNNVGKFDINEESIVNISRSELLELYRNSNAYIHTLESKLTTYEAELLSLKNAADFQKQRDPTYREKVLLRKLAMKEQEIQDFVTQMNELKAAQIPSMATLKSTFLDPAVNIIVQKLKTELSSTKASLEETQNELNAWKFTPDSNTGKRLMAKCRLLHHENEELGKMISSGRVAKLEGELALQKSFNEEVKKSQFELDELLQDLDEDVEGMQGTIYYLQQELKKSKDKMADLEKKNRQLRESFNQSEGNFDDMFKVEDESSNDSACLILKVNPEEEYATMLNIVEETNSNQKETFDFKNKRSNEEAFKNVPPKKQKRKVSQEFADVKNKE